MASASGQTQLGGERLGPWQEKLAGMISQNVTTNGSTTLCQPPDFCTSNGYRTPIYQIASDRRGGRTAWSCTVDVQGHVVPARYWYDGQYVHNAKEDAACVALERLQSQSTATGPSGTWPEYNAR